MNQASPSERALGNGIGIMQGRLSPPQPGKPQYFPADRWEKEFALARACGFQAIEWLFDATSGEENPILSPMGREAILRVSDATGIAVRTVCADFFKDYTLAAVDQATRQERAAMLGSLIGNAAELGIRCILVPFLEGASLQNSGDKARARQALLPCLDLAGARGLAVAVETDLPAGSLAAWITDVDHPALGVYYDLGNAVALGYDPAREIPELAPWLRGVHVKDRTPGGPNVPLGTGAVDFGTCFRALAGAGYQGLLVLETVRGDEYVADAQRHLRFVQQQLEQVGQVPRRR